MLYFKYLSPVLNIQNGPLLVTNVVIAPLLGVISPQLPIYVWQFVGVSYNSIYNNGLGAHLLPSFQSSENATLGTRHVLQAHATSKDL